MSAPKRRALTQEQFDVINHGVDGNTITDRSLLVLAGAGTGKTETIASAVAHRMNFGLDPNRIRVLAFNRQAVGELERRIIKKLKTAETPVHRLRARTFHATGLEYIRRFPSHVGLCRSFTILNSEASMLLLEECIAKERLEFSVDTKALIAFYSLQQQSSQQISQLQSRARLRELNSRTLERIFRRYKALKLARNVVDFDDLLTMWDRLLDCGEIAEEIKGEIDWIVVDEYQDITPLQDRLLRKLRPNNNGLLLVGDHDQSICSYRGVRPETILRRAKEMQTLRLTRNFRSTQPILNACNAVISYDNTCQREPLTSARLHGPRPRLTHVPSNQSQVSCIIKRIKEAIVDGIPLREQAVLARTRSETDLLFAELSKAGLPVQRCGGSSLLDSLELRALIQLIQWIQNPQDIHAGVSSLNRFLGMPYSDASKLLGSIQSTITWKHLSLVSSPKVARFAARIRRIRRLCWDEQLATIHRSFVLHNKGHRSVRTAARKFWRQAAQYASRGDFLDSVSLGQHEDHLEVEQSDRLVVSTFHAAKGREWKAVYIVNTVDGCVPFAPYDGEPNSIEEECRIFFVGLTRAKRRLELFLPGRLARIGKSRVALARTRFIPKRYIDLFVQLVDQQRFVA